MWESKRAKEGRRGRKREGEKGKGKKKLSPLLSIPCLAEQSIGRQVWAADGIDAFGTLLHRRNSGWPSKYQPDNAQSNGATGGRLDKTQSSEMAHAQNLRSNGGSKKHDTLGCC